MRSTTDERGGGRSMGGIPGTHGSGQGVDDLFRDHYLVLVRLAVHLVDDQATAEDVVQDVFAALQSGRRTPADPLAYLRAAVVNRSRSALRRRRTVRLFTAGLGPLGRERHEEPADANGERREDRDRILRAVAALPRRQREVVVLRFYEELSVPETAAALGITAGAVSSSANRALAGLATLLGDIDA